VIQVVRACESDFPAWLRLTAQAETLFGPMLSDPGYLAVVRRKITRGNAYCVRHNDGPPGSELAGGLLFSAHPPRYRIGWLVVSVRCRRQGVGQRLVACALESCQRPCEVWVTTFAPGVSGGAAAIAFYRSLGFQPDILIEEPSGPPTRQEYRLVLP
jgi:ribosomal protein S18 acetylase RimI-like enzyme